MSSHPETGRSTPDAPGPQISSGSKRAGPAPQPKKRLTKAEQEAEIRKLKEELEAARAGQARAQAQAQAAMVAAAAGSSSQPASVNANDGIRALLKPPGEAGSHFSLIKAMGLEDNRELYRTVKRVVRDSAIRSNIDFAQDYRNLPPERVAVIFRAVRCGSPYMDPKRFPNDWATAEILKQYLKNYRRHAVKKGRMPRRKDRLARSSSSAAGSSSPPRVPHARRGSVDGERSGNEDDMY